jgi:exodeoxyribonuclease VII large subunit
MIRAIRYFNEQPELADVLVVIRGGGSADDLAAFNDEKLVREIAASRIPTLVGVGHEVDTSLADMAADVRAATPSNAAQLLVPDRREIIASVRERVRTMAQVAGRSIEALRVDTRRGLIGAYDASLARIEQMLEQNQHRKATLRAYDPQAILRRGYALVRGTIAVGEHIDIETETQQIEAEVQHVKAK